MDQLLNLFEAFSKNAISEEQTCLISGGEASSNPTLGVADTCNGHNCCKETAGSDTTTDDVCTGDVCDPDDGPDFCV